MTHETETTEPRPLFVTISEHLGAEVHPMPEDVTPEDIARHDDDELEAFKEAWGYNDADCIFSVEDARAAALYILEQTGGLPPIKKLLERVAALGAAIEEGDPQSIADAWVHYVTPALAETRELGEF